MSSTKPARSLLRGSSIVAFLTLGSRVLGFLRDLLMAQLLGAGLYADAFVVAFRIPNLLRSIFAEGAFTSGFVPSFADERVKGREFAAKALREVFTVLLVASGLVTLVGILGASSITRYFAPGFVSDPEKFELVTVLTQLMFPYIVCVSIVAMVNGALNAYEVFGVGAFGQIVMNLTMILGILVAGVFEDPATSTIVLGIAVTVGGIFQVFCLFPYMRTQALQLGFSRTPLSPVVRQTIRLMVPAILGGAVYQLIIFTNTLLASLLPDGSVSWLYYADRLAQLPIGVFTVALASVLLPTLSVSAAKGDNHKFFDDLNNALRYTAFCIMPLSGGLWLFAEPCVQLLFERGEFGPHATLMSAQALKAACFGLWFTSSYSMVLRGFLAQKRPEVPTCVGVATLLCNVFFAVLFIGSVGDAGLGKAIEFFRSLMPVTFQFGHVGLALSSSVSSGISFIIITFLFKFFNPQFQIRSFCMTAWRSFFCVVSSILLIQLLQVGSAILLLDVVIKAALFGVLYLALSFVLRSEEISEIWALSGRLQARLRFKK